MPRKSLLSAALMLVVAVGVAGLSIAADEESELGKKMTAIQAKTNAIRKATRTLPAWKKDQASVVKDAEKIAELGKESRKEKGPSEAQKKSYDEWTKLMDDMVKSCDDLTTLAKKSDTTQAQAKDAFNSLNKTCSACHSVFRVEDEK